MCSVDERDRSRLPLDLTWCSSVSFHSVDLTPSDFDLTEPPHSVSQFPKINLSPSLSLPTHTLLVLLLWRNLMNILGDRRPGTDSSWVPLDGTNQPSCGTRSLQYPRTIHVSQVSLQGCGTLSGWPELPYMPSWCSGSIFLSRHRPRLCAVGTSWFLTLRSL